MKSTIFGDNNNEIEELFILNEDVLFETVQVIKKGNEFFYYYCDEYFGPFDSERKACIALIQKIMEDKTRYSDAYKKIYDIINKI